MQQADVNGEDSDARLFLALWPGPAARLAMGAWQTQSPWLSAAKLTRPEHLHLTLHFLGQVPRRRLTEISDGLEVHGGSVDLCLDHAELWGNGVAVLLPRSVPPALLALQQGLGEALQRLRLPLDQRVFRPHVTLARHVRASTVPPKAPLAAPVHWRAHGYVLVESRGGYHVLRHYADK